MATAVLTAVLPVSAKKTPADSIGHFADVNGQHVFYTVHGAGNLQLPLCAEAHVQLCPEKITNAE